MSFLSWFTEPESANETALKERLPRREPMHSRPSLERLEERTLLNATNGTVGGAFNNLNLNSNFNFASNGIVSPVATNNVLASGQHAVDPSGMVSSGTTALASSAALPAQDQSAAQFRVFGVNSQGPDGNRIQQVTANLLRDAYGFGSGSQPNSPWKPNSYNLGLANRQPDYSTQMDNGFSSAAPWARQWTSPVALSQPRDRDSSLNPDQSPSIDREEEAPQAPEQRADHRSLLEQEQSKLYTLDLDLREQNDDLKVLMDDQPSDEKSPLSAVAPADGTLPDTLWLSALSPAPMAALIAGLPGMATECGEAADGGDVAAPE